MLEKVIELIWAPWKNFHIFIVVVRINNLSFSWLAKEERVGEVNDTQIKTVRTEI